MDAEQFKEDIRTGRITIDRVVELLMTLQRQLQAAQEEIERLRRDRGVPPTETVSQPFSVRAEEQRQQARRGKPRKRKARGGRKRTVEKVAQAARTEPVFPAGVPKADCWLSHTRVAWRIENGQAVLVAYQVYRGPNSQYGKIPGVFGRSEFGIEIVLAVAFQVYVIGLSFDKTCLLMNFFQNLNLRKSQAEALMRRLAQRWEKEFDLLCMLLANSLVVHTDETGWSIKSVWAFLSEKARVILFCVPKDAETLKQILDPATFAGLLISDDAAIYANFTHAQKCWAHLLRKAIKLTILDPANTEYRHLTDRLLEIYHAACRVQRDKRLSTAGRAEKVAAMDDEILELCFPMWVAELPPGEGLEDDYRRLCNEVVRLMLEKQLFSFVTTAAVQKPNGEIVTVSGTNNEAERVLRSPAQARDTGRTNKTLPGGRRQTVIVSVFESLRQYLSTFTLSGVIAEVGQWLRTGRSCFARLAEELGLSDGQLHGDRSSLLDRLIPLPDG
jgi:hypothetical protein